MRFLETFVRKNFRIIHSQGYISQGALELLCGYFHKFDRSASTENGFVPIAKIPRTIKKKLGLSEDLNYFPKRILYRWNHDNPEYSDFLREEFARELHSSYLLHHKYVDNFRSYRISAESATQKAISLMLMKVALNFLEVYDDFRLVFDGLKLFGKTGEIELTSAKAFHNYVRSLRKRGLFEGILLSK